MRNLNVFYVTGRLGSDAKRFNSALAFGIANRQDYKDKNGDLVEQTHWFNVSAYGVLADNLENVLVKGTKVLVTGHLSAVKNDEGKTVVYLNASSVEIVEYVKDDGATKKPAATAGNKKKVAKPQSNWSKKQTKPVDDDEDDVFGDDEDFEDDDS